MTWERLRESVYLTVRTTAMVCWLFVGSNTFASVFAYLGGSRLIADFVLGIDLTPLTFLIMAQIVIFILGWPLEWTEIIIIFVPIFLPLLPHFGIDPLFFGILIALNLQTAFLSPPMAMSAYYLKGIAPPHVTINQIFAGCMPFMIWVLVAMVIVYVFPQIAFWLPGPGLRAMRPKPAALGTAEPRRGRLARPHRRRRAAGRAIAAEALIARIEATEPEVRAWAWFDPAVRPGAGEGARRAPRHRAAGRGAARGAGRGQGHHRHRADPDRERHADRRRAGAARGRLRRGAAEGGGRADPRQDRDDRARLHAAGADRATRRRRGARPAARRPARRRRSRPGRRRWRSAPRPAGSVIRPAAFCGVVGFKPSFGAIPRGGILAQSPSLDTVGVFARSVPDAALIAEALFGHDPRDRATAPAPAPRLLETALSRPPLPPVLGFVRPPGWEAADPDTRAALEELAASLGDRCFEVDAAARLRRGGRGARAYPVRRDGEMLPRIRAARPRGAERAAAGGARRRQGGVGARLHRGARLAARY